MKVHLNQDWHLFAANARAAFAGTPGTPGKLYKLFVEDWPYGLSMCCVGWCKPLHVLAVRQHNMARCAINSKPQTTAMNMAFYTDGRLRSVHIAPATLEDIAKYGSKWT